MANRVASWSLLFLSCIGSGVAVTVVVPKQASAAEAWPASFGGVFEDLANTVADSEMGEDLGASVFLMSKPITSHYEGVQKHDLHIQEHGPATLAEYCEGETTVEHTMKLRKGARVMANWEEYGTYYPGRITKQHEDGTVDIYYDDGFVEDRVKPHQCKHLEEKHIEYSEEVKQRNDAACEMLKFLEKTKGKIKVLYPMISEWLAAQRAKVASKKMAGLKAPSPSTHIQPVVETEAPMELDLAPSPAQALPAAPAPAPALVSAEVEDLKVQLADRDAHIKDLKKQKEENARELQKYLPDAAPSPPKGMQSVDDLIAQYKAKIADRDKEISELTKEVKEQEQELARLGARQPPLKDIDAAIEDLESDAEEALQKRHELAKSGELDQDLRAIIDKMTGDISKMRQNVDTLSALDAKAKENKAEEERKGELAIQAARKMAEKTGKDPDKAAAKEAERVGMAANEAAHDDEFEVLKAAQEVKKDLDEADKGAAELDTGLHPHGSKWWRYRYEHSYIEALIMIFVSILQLFFCFFMRWLKHRVRLLGLPEGARPPVNHTTDCFQFKAPISEVDDEVHGTTYRLWLKSFAEQMMVCIFVFLFVWTLATVKLIDLFVLVIPPTGDLHVPHTGDQYRQLAFDACQIFYFAIAFYYCLMFPVARDSRDLNHVLQAASDGSEIKKISSVMDYSATEERAGADSLSKKVMGGLRKSKTAFLATKSYFAKCMQKEMTRQDDDDMKEIMRLLDNDIDNFPLLEYLVLNVRISAGSLFEFSWTTWLPVVASFFVFMLLHRFEHVGYVRIMCVFALLILVIIVAMAWYTKHLGHRLTEAHKAFEEEEEATQAKEAFVIKESVVLSAFKFTLFFLCYFVARMICQPWMWKLHFWPVLCLTVFAFISVIFFIVLVSPAIPAFCAIMALPPQIDEDNVEVMLHVAKGVNKDAARKS